MTDRSVDVVAIGRKLCNRTERRGFGAQMLERGLAREAGGEVQLDFAPEGVACRIRLPPETSVLDDG